MNKPKTYIELANERAEQNKQDKANKYQIERDKLEYKKSKDKTNHIISIVLALPVIILIIIFVIVFIVLLCK